ncbi:MAG: hypothetical protein ACO1OB_14180 [Archangium sp.]
MATAKAFNPVVAARTQTAMFIAQRPDLLEKWNALGGLLTDLEAIIEHGKRAEALDREQSTSKMDAEASTTRVRDAFEALKKEHAAILTAVTAMRPEFAGQSVDVHLEAIVRNQGPLRQVKDGTRRRRRSSSYEAVRAEIASDAVSLLNLEAVADALSKRRVTRARLEALKRAAEALPAKVIEQLSAKGSRRVVTKNEHDAVAAQRLRWGSVYGLLRRLASEDPGVASMLKAAAR